MKSVLRALAITTSFAIIAGYGRLAFSGTAPPMDKKQIQLWSGCWQNEVGRQSVPTPQLLFICGQPSETEVRRLKQMEGLLNLAGSMADFDPYLRELHDLREWHLEWARRLGTEAFEQPSAFADVEGPIGGTLRIRRDFEGHFPALCLRPPQEYRTAFSWGEIFEHPRLFFLPFSPQLVMTMAIP